jgi:subtilisin-like proprotein convertase family protein
MTNTTSTQTSVRHAVLRRLAAASAAVATAAALVLTGGAAAWSATADASNGASVPIPDSQLKKNNTLTINVPDSGPADVFPSTNTVLGEAGTVMDVEVWIPGIEHTNLDDLDIMLVGPGGQRSMLMSDAGGVADKADIIFDDEAPTAVPTDGVNGGSVNGVYRPVNYGLTGDGYGAGFPSGEGVQGDLSVFDGTNPNGAWKLFVYDDVSADSGRLVNGWRLYITTTSTGPNYPAAVQVSGATGTVTDVDVHLEDFLHSYPADVDVLLEGPTGRRALVMADVADNTSLSAPVDLTLDDEAATSLPEDGVQLTSGTFRPLDADSQGFTDADMFPALDIAGVGSALSVFDGTDPNGTWKLFVVDDLNGSIGAIQGGWSLHVATTDPAPGGTTPAPAPAPAPLPAAADTTHPTVTSHQPGTGARKVARSVDVTATFSEGMRASTVTAKSVRLVRKGSTKAVLAKVVYSAKTRTVVLDPAQRLAAGKTYRVVVTAAAKDRAGNTLDQQPTTAGSQQATWVFRTKG